MRINFSCFRRQIYINVIPYEKPKWLVKLLLPWYWKKFPWRQTQTENSILFETDNILYYEWVPVESLIGKVGYEYRWQNGKLYTRIYNG